MQTHDELEDVFHTLEEMLSVININVEFTFNGVVNQDACLNTDLVTFGVPVSFIGDWDSIPSVRINMSQSFTDASNNSLC